MSYYGYAGKVLYVDLTGNTFRKEDLDMEVARKFLGGQGVSSKLAYDLIAPGVDPLSPQNVLVYGVSPFTGTFMPGFPRAGMVSKSPLTGLLMESNSGNSIGPMLKYAGYDHLVISGRARRPVCLVIDNDDVRIEDASDMWGMDVFEASDAIRAKLGHEYWTSCIGPGGENLVSFACVTENKNGMLGRAGLGAVAGSKKLKGIAVRGTKGTKVHRRREFRQLAEEMRRRIAEYPLIDLWRNEGKIIDAYMKPFYQRGIYGKRNYGEGAPEVGTEVFTQKEFAGEIWKSYYACFGCPCGCKGVIGVAGGRYPVPDFKISNPWGTPMLFIDCGAGGWKEAVKPAYLASKYGIDAFETLRVISFAIELHRKGIISREDADGLEMDWNVETILALVEKIARRDGIGAILARGVRGASKEIGGGAEKYAVHVKGLAPTMDLRGSRTADDNEPYLFLENFGQLVDPRGAHHARSWSITYVPRKAESIRRYAVSIGVPGETVDRIVTESGWNLPRLLKWVDDFDTMAFSLGLCMRPQMMSNYDLNGLARLFAITTGIELTPGELLEGGERIWNLQRLFNAREGASWEDDMPPGRMMTEPLAVGQKLNPPVDGKAIRDMLGEYYQESGWDEATGVPTKEKLGRLGLEEEARGIGVPARRRR